MADGTVKASDFIRVPLAEVTQPRDGAMAYVNKWWVVTPENEVLFFKKKWRSPQCNSSQAMVERCLPAREYIPGCRAELVPIAFVPILWAEYQ